jgi:hypothetical protein
MDPVSDDFAGLRSLLKLKRYEQPPPRYFDDLSRGVIHRLRGPEGLREQSLFSSLGLRAGWKPALFYGLGVVCCVLSLYGVVSLLVKGPVPEITDPQTASVFNTAKELSPFPVTTVLRPDGRPDEAVGSTNPVLSPGTVGYPIDPYKLRTTPVSYEKK